MIGKYSFFEKVLIFFVPIMGISFLVIIRSLIASQVSGVFVLPLVMVGVIVLITNEKLLQEFKAGPWLKFGLWAAFIFSLIISVNGILGLIGLIK